MFKILGAVASQLQAGSSKKTALVAGGQVRTGDVIFGRSRMGEDGVLSPAEGWSAAREFFGVHTYTTEKKQLGDFNTLVGRKSFLQKANQ